MNMFSIDFFRVYASRSEFLVDSQQVFQRVFLSVTLKAQAYESS